jgi:hemolysin activation/secretion protein
MRFHRFNTIAVCCSFLSAGLTASLSNTVVAAEPPASAAANPEAAVSRFDLLELRVKGNNVLDRHAIERCVYPFLGKQKSIDIVEQARLALEELYHSKGFQTVSIDIPEQNVVNGVVYLQVNEGKIARLRVTDSRYFSQGAIKEKVPALAEGTVPNLPQMQQQLAALAKESSDRTITPVLRAGETPGTLEVDLKVKDDLPLHGKVEVNGRNTTSTERLRTAATLRYDNLWQKFHSASFMYQVSPENPKQVEVLVGSYVMPVFESGQRLAFFAVNSSSNSVANAGALSVVGAGDLYGLRYVSPIATPIKNYFQTVTAGFTYKDFKQNLNGATVNELFRQTPITYVPFVLGYNGNIQDEQSRLSFNINANFSIRNLGNRQSQFNNTRYQAKANYAYLTAGVEYKRNLPHGMSFEGRFNGQVANSPLIPNEQFSLGGQQSVRGYYETQVLADDGVQASLELYSPKLDVWDWAEQENIRGVVFVDAGRGWLKSTLNGSPSQFDLASVGTGFRMQLWKTLTANFDIAVPFTNQTRVERGNPRLHFQVFTEF